MTRQRRLRVVASRAGAAERQRPVFRKRKGKRRPRLILEALLMMAGGVGLLVLLLQLPQLIDLDSLLLVSTALAHLIGGLSQLLIAVRQRLGEPLLGGFALLALWRWPAVLVGDLRAVVAPPKGR